MVVTDIQTLDLEDVFFYSEFKRALAAIGAPCRSALFVVGSGPGNTLVNVLSELANLDVSVVDGVGNRPVEVVLKAATQANADIVVGIGGGAVLDRGKIAAKLAKAPYIAIPTVLSQDGLYSQSAVVRFDGNVQRFLCKPPQIVVPAARLVEEAPEVFTRACIGDLISNYSAVEDCLLAGRAGRQISKLALAKSVEAADLAANWLPTSSKVDLLPAIKLSGQAMAIAGNSSPCSGAEHKIASALGMASSQCGLHGEIVGVGTVFMATFRGDAHFEKILSIAERHGLPLTPNDLGLTKPEFVDAVLTAATLRPSRYTILDTLDIDRDRCLAALEKIEIRRRLSARTERV